MAPRNAKKALNSVARMLLMEERLQAGLTDDEHEFHAAAEIGDLDAIKRLVASGKVSITCMDLMGRTSLELATAANDTDLVRYFIEAYPEHLIHNGFLCAVENDRDKLCEIYLDHGDMYTLPIEDNIPAEGSVKKSGNDKIKHSEKFHAVQEKLREALIIAACRNNFVIVKMLLVRGVTLDIPHEYLCLCKTCGESRNADFMMFTNNRHDTFRAIASPAYIALTELDPVMAAFLLSDKFRKTAEIETEYKQTYYDLDTQVQQFTLDLLETCRSSDEVRTLLGCESSSNDNQTDMPMIQMALSYQQKKFLAHRKCQAQVAQLWFSGVPLLRYLNNFNYLMLSIPIGMVLIPLLSIVYLCTGIHKIEHFLDTPIMRFLSFTTSYVTFLLLMVNSKLTMNRQWSQITCSETELTTLIFIAIIFLWLIGLIWEESKQLYEAGAIDYFSSIWNIVDSCMLSLLLSSVILDLVVALKLKQIIQERHTTVFDSHNVTYSLPICDYNRSGPISFCDIHRDYDFIVEWNPVWIPDPEMLSDICFSVGIVLSVSRIAFLMPCNETFGTMLVSFYRTLMDLFKLCGMFILVLLAFTCGIAALYDAMQCHSDAFGSPGGTMGYLIWGMFGMGESNAPDLKNKGEPLHSIINNFEAKKNTIVIVGYILYGTFIFASTIVLMNLLIAVMANTFQEIQDEQEYEWKFSRTELWLTFIEGGCPLPPPFNILPGANDVKRLCTRFLDFCYFNCPEDKDVSVIMEKSEPGKSMDDNESLNYVERKQAITTLIRRYIVQSTKEKLEDNEAGSDDVMRRLIENMGSKLVRKIEQLRDNINSVESDVVHVQKRENEIRQVQEDQTKLAEAQIEMAKKIQAQIDDLAVDVRKALEPPPPPPPSSGTEDDSFIPLTKL